jgi:hypothetical protein
MNETGLWRGYWTFLASGSAAAVAMQIDLAMVARLGGRASGAYAILMRVTLLDLALTMAAGAVAAIAAAHAQKSGDVADAAGQICVIALALGAATAVFGFFAYPLFLKALMGAEEAGPFLGWPIIWLVGGTPLRMLANAQGFILHALGRGASVFKWRLLEIPARAAANFLFMGALGLGFAGCFLGGCLVAALSSLWLWSQLREHGVCKLRIPRKEFALSFLRATFWESHRVLSPRAAMLVSLMCFSAAWFGEPDIQRLDSFAAGQAFMLFLLAPLTTLTRFLAFRLSGKSLGELMGTLAQIFRAGAPIGLLGVFVLLAGKEWIGDSVYAQRGPWWSMLVTALALSLPIRYVGSALRGAALAQGLFARQLLVDGVAQWLLALPLIMLGLFLNNPAIAYLSLILPEAICVLWIWWSIQRPAEGRPFVLSQSKGQAQ